MATSLSDISKEVTPEEVLDLFLEIATDIGLPITAWQTGEPVRAVLEIVATVFAKIWNTGMRPLLAMPILDFCFGDILTLVALALFGTSRIEALFAQGGGTVTNSGPGVYTFGVGELRILGSNGKVFYNRTSGSIAQWTGSGPFPTLDLNFIAEDIGAASTLIPGGGAPTVLSGQTGISVDHIVAWIGQDEEQDEPLRVRARAQAASNSWGGPKLAYEYFLKSTLRADGITTIPVNRVKVGPPPGDGTLSLLVAGPSGAIDPSDVALLQANIEENVEPVCTTSTVTSATNVVVNVSAVLYVKKGTAASLAISNAAKLAVASFFLNTPIAGFKKTEFQSPGKLYLSEVEAVISESHPAIYLVELAGSDVNITATQVAALGTLSLVVAPVAQ